MAVRASLEDIFEGSKVARGHRHDDPNVKRNRRMARRSSKVKLLPSEWVSEFVNIKDGDSGQVLPIDFTERKYLERPYNTAARKILFLTSRQAEKCSLVRSQVLTANGSLKEAGDIKLGDLVVTKLPDESMGVERVTWVSDIFQKPCVRITTNQGHILECSTTHPVRTWESWTEAGELKKGDRIAVIRRGGQFTGKATPPKERIRLTACLIGDGGLTDGVRFTKTPGPLVDELVGDVERLGGSYSVQLKKGSAAVQVIVNKLPVLWDWLESDGLMGKKSPDKFIPEWVFDLSREDTALFLNRLWATDGHVHQRTRSQYNIDYSSMSYRLVKQVQALLWKFGVPTRIRKNWPNYYKKRGIERYAYILSVQTREGVSTFLEQIGALDKSEGVPLPEVDENNNRDTVPIEVQGLIDQIIGSRTDTWRTKLSENGLHRTLEYPPTRGKLKRMVEVLREDGRFDEELLSRLENHATSNIYWDRIKSVEFIGEQDCIDFEVGATSNFIADGLVTHNSTTLGNKLLALSGMRSMYTSLFVSPSAMQTAVFSKARINDIIDISPKVKALTHRSLTMNLLEKEFVTRSRIYLRYAFLSADRIRGLSVNAIFGDEIQDLLSHVMPVIEETASHHKNSLYVYSGTPKTLDNTIENYWSKSSTMAEWAIPCEKHGTPNRPHTWHWNVLGVKNLGKQGPICDRCGGPINPEHPYARWVEMRPGAEFEGYRICRLMVPWFWKNPDKWKEILQAYERYPTAQFFNEVMAISYDSGTKPITRMELIRACDDTYDNDLARLEEISKSHQIFLGVDWGPGDEGNAYSVVCAVAYCRDDDSLQVVYWRRFDGPMTDPERQLKELERLIETMNVRYVGTDYGMGFYQNKRLTSKYGPKRIHTFQYSARLPSKVAYSGKLHRYLVFRSPVMADVFTALKRGKVRLPRWTDIESPYGDDVLRIFSEYSDTVKMIKYDKPRGGTDDSFHALVYAVLASMFEHRRPDIIAPIKENEGVNSLGIDSVLAQDYHGVSDDPEGGDYY